MREKKEKNFTLRIDEHLLAEFLDVCRARDEKASAVIRNQLRGYIRRWRDRVEFKPDAYSRDDDLTPGSMERSRKPPPKIGDTLSDREVDEALLRPAEQANANGSQSRKWIDEAAKEQDRAWEEREWLSEDNGTRTAARLSAFGSTGSFSLPGEKQRRH